MPNPGHQGEDVSAHARAARAKRIHVAQLCVLVAALVMAVSSLIPELMFDERPLSQRAARLVIGSWHGVAMFGCLFWSRRRPAFALPIAALILVGVVGTNLFGVEGGIARDAAFAVLAVVVLILLRGAHAGFAEARTG